MGILDILGKLYAKEDNTVPHNTRTDPEVISLFDLGNTISDLTSANKYISRKEYSDILSHYKDTVDYFATIERSGLLRDFAKKNKITSERIYDVLDRYSKIENLVEKSNEQFITDKMSEEKDYLDGILKDVDPQISLDDDQRRVVLSDEDFTLVIAGAGAGKTTTVAAKVKYLVEKQHIPPEKILVISFTNKSVNELKEKIKDSLSINCNVSTFHSVGNAILRNQNEGSMRTAESYVMYYVLQDYFKNKVLKNESMVNNLILFFASYFEDTPSGEDLNSFFAKIAKSNYTTLKSDFNEFSQTVMDIRTKKAVTIQAELLRSYEEVEIANYLYLNGIDYEYEPLYKYNILNANKPYTPDFRIKQGEHEAYIEHFGITQDGRNDRFTLSEIERYKKSVNDKILIHREHGTELIYTFSRYNDGRPFLEHLEKQLTDHGFHLHPRSNEEVIQKLITTEENRYIRKLLSLITRFITNFKTNGYERDKFDEMSHSTQNVRSKLFLHICYECYLEYQSYLKQNNMVDFQDMINESAKIIRSVKEAGEKIDYKYIIVDEYQDISRQRFDLVSALHEVCDAKIIAVGDDWQSIYAFSGSDITLFTKFKEKMGYANLLKIVRTYRNSQEVIDIAGNFIQKNTNQIRKSLIANKHITDPVIIFTYDAEKKKQGAKSTREGANYNLAKSVETALEHIIASHENDEKPLKKIRILLLGRYGFDGDNLEKTGLFEFISRGSLLKSVKYPNLNIEFMTAHASKGLGYDDVIIINGKNETYGFPSKIEDDPVLSFVIKGDNSIDYAEERRLFYVALTRTKNRVYCIAPIQNPSEFLLEIKRDYKNVVLSGNWNDSPKTSRINDICPICGYPLQRRFKKAFNMRLWICTNEPELCSFVTNDIQGGKLSICKCDRCQDGYLIVKKSNQNNVRFLGCTNYKNNGTGCNNVLFPQQYYKLMGYENESYWSENEDEVSPAPRTRGSKKAITESNQTQTAVHPISAEKVAGNDINLLVRSLLEGLREITEICFINLPTFVSVMRGETNEYIVRKGLNRISYFGCMKDLSVRDIDLVIQWMIAKKIFYLPSGKKNPLIRLSYEANNIDEIASPAALQALRNRLKNRNKN